MQREERPSLGFFNWQVRQTFSILFAFFANKIVVINRYDVRELASILLVNCWWCLEEIWHSDLEMTLQVITASSKNPLTPGRWVHMGLKNDEIEIFCPCGYTKHFSKTKIAPFHSYQQSYLQLFDMYLNAIYLSSENIVTWNRQSYQWAIFNPESSQKGPKRANLASIR